MLTRIGTGVSETCKFTYASHSKRYPEKKQPRAEGAARRVQRSEYDLSTQSKSVHARTQMSPVQNFEVQL
jgi:hypothetical protein